MIKILVSVLSSIVLTTSALAFPSKPVKIIVPTGPGGGLDIIARTVAKHLEDTWKTGVIVENKPGANAMIATNAVLDSEPDGHTVLFYSATTYGAFQGVTTGQAFVWEDHLTALNMMWSPPFVLVVNPGKNIKNMSDLRAAGQSKGLTFGSTAGGSPLEIYGSIATERMAVSGITVNYKSVPQILTDLINGQLDFAVLNWANVVQHIDKGSLTALFVFDNKRLDSLPNLPTLTSPEYSEFQNVLVAYNFFVNKTVPAIIQERLRHDIERATAAAMPELIQRNLLAKHKDTRLNLTVLRQAVEGWRLSAQKLATRQGQPK